MNRNSIKRHSRCILLTLLSILYLSPVTSRAETTLNPVTITEWNVPWEQTRPRDPYVDRHNQVWFVGQTGDYIAVLDPETGNFRHYPLDPGTGPHNLIVDTRGMVWYAGNRTAHIGNLDPDTGTITKYPMPNDKATDPHTLVFGPRQTIWFTVQQGNYVGQLDRETGSVLLTPLLSQHARPYGIVMDPKENPWFTQFGTNKLGTLEPGTHTVKEILLPRQKTRPRRLAITSDSTIWYVDYAEGYLGSVTPDTLKVKEWRAPGGEDARPYGMTVDDKDRIWFVETGLFPNRLVGFDTQTQQFISITEIESGGGTVRNMFYHKPTQTIWFGTDANTIGRAKIP